MPRTRPPYPLEFRRQTCLPDRQVVELVQAGRTARELAREFEPSYETIRSWVKQTDRDEGRDPTGMTTGEREELRRLRRENRQLRLEREILAKAAALRCVRPARYRPSLRVHERTPGSLPGGHDVPRALWSPPAGYERRYYRGESVAEETAELIGVGAVEHGRNG